MFTRIALVNFCLEQAQLDSTFQTLGRKWLNHALLKLVKRSNYKNLNTLATDAPFVAGVTSYALPADFGRSDACFFVNSAGAQGSEIQILEPYQFDPHKQGSIIGAPSVCMIDRDTMTIKFNAAPSPTTTDLYRLRYWKSAPSYSLDSADDSVVPDFDDQDVLLQEMLAIAFEFNDDERQDKKKMEAKMSRQEFQRNMYESDNKSTIDLDRTVFRPRTGVTRRSYRAGS